MSTEQEDNVMTTVDESDFLNETPQEEEEVEELSGEEEINKNVQEAVIAYDQSREARINAMKQVESTLQKASKGGKIDRKDVAKALKGLYYTNDLQDKLILGLVADTIRLVRAIAIDESQNTVMGLHLKTLIAALVKKEVVSEEYLNEVYNNDIMKEHNHNNAASNTSEVNE